ncbi:hypothetical protein [Oricola cellulosilytica]|uniref:Lipoprotein n=1 Tax=Oricola cellulosilytica TaxID=1429082 RepID=A0A4R0PEV9_9HYPH|nr:hypothetical protein [Oricola cellulosilytica]TCD15178.1 hypothetical protein E0D97_06410 [Oricola cellulosilytica]
MRKFVNILLPLALSGCVDAAPPPAEEPKLEVTPGMTDGQKAAAIYSYCGQLARRECPRATIACDAYRPEFVKICMTRAGVRPDYTLMLLSR